MIGEWVDGYKGGLVVEEKGRREKGKVFLL